MTTLLSQPLTQAALTTFSPCVNTRKTIASPLSTQTLYPTSHAVNSTALTCKQGPRYRSTASADFTIIPLKGQQLGIVATVRRVLPLGHAAWYTSTPHQHRIAGVFGVVGFCVAVKVVLALYLLHTWFFSQLYYYAMHPHVFLVLPVIVMP